MNPAGWLNGRAAAMTLGLAVGALLARTIWPATAQTPMKPDPVNAAIYAISALSVDTARLADSVVDLRDKVAELERRLAAVEQREPGKPPCSSLDIRTC